MIVVVIQINTDGDFSVDFEQAKLEGNRGCHDYCGTFLCSDTEEAESVLERALKSINASDFNFRWFVETFGEAFRVLREESDSLRFGWCRFLGGNYDDTHLFMQSVQTDTTERRK